MRAYSSKSVGPSPKTSSRSVSKSMRSNKKSGTGPELILSRLLRKKLVKSDLPGSPDFVYRKARVAVFVNGCFWHRCPVCNLNVPKTNPEFWQRKFARNIERDRLVKGELERAGWYVMQIWEHEVRADPSTVAREIKSVVARRASALG